MDIKQNEIKLTCTCPVCTGIMEQLNIDFGFTSDNDDICKDVLDSD